MSMGTETKPVVLAVDDEPQILNALAALLSREFDVLRHCSGSEAIETLKQRDVAVILSDQRMPGMTGDQLLEQACRVSNATRLLVTGYSDQEATVRAVNAGKIYAFVAKPWDPIHLIDIVQKAAEYYALHRELEHERRLLSYLMDSTADAIYFRDQDMRLTRINAGYAGLLGLDAVPVDLTDEPGFDELVAERTGELHVEDRQVIESLRAVTDRTACVRAANGAERWHSVSTVPILGSDGGAMGLIGISRDITDRRQVAEDLRRSNEELERFAYVASHDLQEPLRTVSSYLQLIKRRYGEKPDARADEYIEFAIDGARRMRSLILGLLEYSRIGRKSAPFQAVDAGRAVDAAVADLRQAIAESGARVTRDQLPHVLGDLTLLTQLFQNLIGNAIKFRSEAAPRVHVSSTAEPDGHRFAVVDNGIGIEPRFRQRVFELFHRLHERDRYPGSGIGLALCRRIVESHGGTIWIDDSDAGSAFCFRLPGC